MITGEVQDMEFDPNFQKITPIFPLREMPSDVINDLSSDQRYAYRMTKMITTGEVDEDLLQLRVGDSCPSRWQTTGNRLNRLYVSKHGLVGERLKKLRLIVEFLVQVYFFMWFEIKTDSSIISGPYHKLKEVKLIQGMKEEDDDSKLVKDIAKKFMEKGAWHAHSEHVLVSLLSSEEESDRHFAISKSTEIRNGSDYGDKSVRPFTAPKLNWNATSIRNLQDWQNATEPLITTSIPTNELTRFLSSPLKLPKIPGHSQSCERAVKEVSSASLSVFGAERREGYIFAKMKSRSIIPAMNSKKDLAALIPNV